MPPLQPVVCTHLPCLLDVVTACCAQVGQAAQCQALSEYTLYSLPTTKAKASKGSVSFSIDLMAPAFYVQSEVRLIEGVNFWLI